jgi:N-methylhydantoinase B
MVALSAARSTGRDPVRVEIVRHELAAVTEEMALAIARTGRSGMVKIGDFAAALADGRGRILGQGYAAPFQLAHFMEVMDALLRRFGDDVDDGDVFVVNDPYSGMGHLPDVALVRPVFADGVRLGFAIAYSHHTDIGGRFPGGFSSLSQSIYEEGVRLPPVRIIERGVRNQALLDTVLANVRAADDWLGDLDAKLAGCRRGEQQLRAVAERHGAAAIEECAEHLLDSSERAMRSAVAALPDGEYAHESVFEDDGFGTAGARLPLAVTLRVHGDSIEIDFAGSAPQAPSSINVPLAMTKAIALAALKVLTPPDVLLNAGLARPVQVHAPDGCVFNPRHPAAVAGRAPLAFRIFELVFAALAGAAPERIPVPGEGGDVLHFTAEDGRAAMDAYFGGWGARPGRDGIDGVTPMTFGSYGCTPVEVLEREHPLMVERFEYVPDSAGAGRWRGSLAVRRTWRFLAAGEAMVRTGRLIPGTALAGGRPGMPSGNTLVSGGREVRLPAQTHVHFAVQPGDSVSHVIGGTGGYGDPMLRDRDAVLEDVREGKLSPAAALRDHGVEVDAAG